MSLDWNRNGKLDPADFFITEMLYEELKTTDKQGRVEKNADIYLKNMQMEEILKDD